MLKREGDVEIPPKKSYSYKGNRLFVAKLILILLKFVKIIALRLSVLELILEKSFEIFFSVIFLPILEEKRWYRCLIFIYGQRRNSVRVTINSS